MPKDLRSAMPKAKQRSTSFRGRNWRGDNNDSNLPPALRSRLADLFTQIEREFENLYSENSLLQEKVDYLADKLDQNVLESYRDDPDASAGKNKKDRGASSSVLTHMKSTYKGKVSQAITNLKIGNNSVECRKEKAYLGHRDGIWEVKCADYTNLILGTASADHTACLWDIESCQRLVQYQGHEGSVNSIRFHPKEPLVCTGSGDSSAHIWRISLGNFRDFNSVKVNADDDMPGKDNNYEDANNSYVIKNPILQLREHCGVVSTADWLQDGDQIVTASWDRTAKLWDIHTGIVVQTLTGHEEDITYAAIHPTQNLLVTSSKDTTFRLWDFRSSSIHSVNVFQGHSNTVTSCVFAKDKIISGSDDRSVKVWDLKNMRSPSATIRLDSAVNRLSVSSNIIAIPHDNRHIRLYDLNGNRIARLPRSNGQGHKRMVCCTAWNEAGNMPCNLFSAGFDRKVIGWSISVQTGNA